MKENFQNASYDQGNEGRRDQCPNELQVLTLFSRRHITDRNQISAYQN